VSAQTGAGLAELCQQIAAALVPEAPPPGAAVPFMPALAAAIHEVRRLVAVSAAQALERLERLCQECG
jgi:hypothetical protein